MFRVRLPLSAASTLIAAVIAMALPRDARATGGGTSGPAVFSLFSYDLCDPINNTFYRCFRTGIRLDVGDPVHVAVTMDYDLIGKQFVFNRGLSGPLGIFSVGGSAPPATPGVGTQPLTIFPTLPDVAGAPLPGSTLTITDDGLAVTVDYLLATPITLTTETNFFLLVFDFITPLVIDASASTVTYSTGPLPNADFTVLTALCETGDPLRPRCGSTQPAVAIDQNLVVRNAAVLPEPSTTALLGSGLALAAALLRRRQNGGRVTA